MTTSHLAAGPGSSTLLLLFAAVIVAAVLLGGFWYGSRRTRSRRSPGPPPVVNPAESGETQRGRTWQTIDDDPDQGAPTENHHRKS
ncbi:DUF6479 family protein [Streptomyces sp. V4-01]|uniref:DUF6479 family protein n=1 Tax=Actinacidiphila polyblastidii TaxID=3110430 RepID=A0ABU7PFM2_9ACTN|nr:DUF6479 family protein [Streptomyces sp. V4-01]